MNILAVLQWDENVICRVSSKRDEKNALLMEQLIGMAVLLSKTNLGNGLLELLYFVSSNPNQHKIIKDDQK